MARGYCYAEQERIADELNIHRKTVNHALKQLVENGYLTASKNSKGRTVIYRDTGKAGIEDLPPADLQEEEEPVTLTVTEPVTKSDTKKEKKEKKNTTTIKGGDDIFSFSENKNLAEKDFLEEQSFLAKASEEQKTAYQKIRLFAGVQKSIERASKDNPIEAARGFLLGIAKHGDTLDKREMANNALVELPAAAMPEASAKEKVRDAKKNRNAELEKEFLEICTMEQDEAYWLVKPFLGVVKAIEKASANDPIAEARMTIEWLADNGNTTTIQTAAEKAMKEWEVVTLAFGDSALAEKLEHCKDAYKFMTDYAMDYASSFDSRFEWRASEYKSRFKNYDMAYLFSHYPDSLAYRRYESQLDNLKDIVENAIKRIYESEFKEEDAKSELQAANF